MSAFDVAAILVGVAALCGYLNYRFLRLPPTSGTLLVALILAIGLVVVNLAVPGWQVHAVADRFVSHIDFDAILLRGMLSFLLFAGALHVDLSVLLRHKWTVGLLATVGVALSTFLVGLGAWMVFRLMGFDVSWMLCFVFGALISPTDPIAVLALMKQVGAPIDLQTQIAGESLFNDGIGVVIFVALSAVAGFALATGQNGVSIAPADVAVFFLRLVVGGGVLGFAAGYLTTAALKTVDNRSLELLITLALVMCGYSVSFELHVSGPIAVVVAGLVVGNTGRNQAMAAETRRYVDAFWNMIDEILNAMLFLLLGLQVLALPAAWRVWAAGGLLIPLILLSRLISVSVPVGALWFYRPPTRGLIPILTWSGLRGGLSVAMVLSLPQFEHRDLLLVATYVTVVFSIVCQGLTMQRLLDRYAFARDD